MKKYKVVLFEGGAGSGNWGHAGRPGKRGGSLPRKASSVQTLRKKEIPPEGLPPVAGAGETVRKEYHPLLAMSKEIWTQLTQRAPYINREGTKLVTLAKDPSIEGAYRIQIWDKFGVFGHRTFRTEDEAHEYAEKNYLKRGQVEVVVTGGIGFPTQNYAGFSFKPTYVHPLSGEVRSFIGNKEDLDWIVSRLESGGYKVKINPVPEPEPWTEEDEKRARTENIDSAALKKLLQEVTALPLLKEGGPGSGFHGHKGRPGKRGGSAKQGTVVPSSSSTPQAPRRAAPGKNTSSLASLEQSMYRVAIETGVPVFASTTPSIKMKATAYAVLAAKTIKNFPDTYKNSIPRVYTMASGEMWDTMALTTSLVKNKFLAASRLKQIADIKKAIERGEFTVEGVTDSLTNTIILNCEATNKKLVKHVLYHEASHAFWNKQVSGKMKAEWQRAWASTKKPPTWQAGENVAEYFAEVMSLYLQGKHKVLSPRDKRLAARTLKMAQKQKDSDRKLAARKLKGGR